MANEYNDNFKFLKIVTFIYFIVFSIFLAIMLAPFAFIGYRYVSYWLFCNYPLIRLLTMAGIGGSVPISVIEIILISIIDSTLYAVPVWTVAVVVYFGVRGEYINKY